MSNSDTATTARDFIREAIAEDLSNGRFDGRFQTRFPPEPNGYLHIGHPKAIGLNFEVAAEFGGLCNLRFDDTNPLKEEQEFVDAQIADIRWLGYEPASVLFASDYFPQLYEWALQLIESGHAYVDDLSQEEIRAHRGTLTEPGKDSPYRDRSVEENLDLFKRMRAGEFPDGAKVLRAKIDMSSPNVNLRDPVMYRIRHAPHQRTGDDWCIYPMYDWAHGQSDSIEGVTHSLCSLEYLNHRPLYDWYLDALGVYHPRQIEFAKLEFTYTVTSKRRLMRLVEEGRVTGWDDPRMPTLAGQRRRGVPAKALRDLCEHVGIARTNSTVEVELLEHFIRQELNRTAMRVMGVLDPLPVVITNYPEGETEWVEAVNNPEDEDAGSRTVPFSRNLLIERDDFMEDPPRKFFRLAPGREVRLRWGYFIRCEEVIRNEQGDVVALHCTYDPDTKGGYAPDGRKVRGTIHWVSADHAVPAEVRLYDRLFNVEDPYDVPDGQDFMASLSPDSLSTLDGARLEPSVRELAIGQTVQFERKGYFCLDPDSAADRLVFNRTITLRDTWARIQSQTRRKGRGQR
ncbi:MAG: glutamine--tRNA ligase/YqeY domain fusion protein [Caldilineaceae bacterium]|nr:glutamine--tRNA ligase/YqeY domain fusion protein [Caldilineaceae bacterium]MCY4116424.1 glutamine--tRNA ligase/YqeY domain fusion protein [Caldilineaceae bacterium]